MLSLNFEQQLASYVANETAFCIFIAMYVHVHRHLCIHMHGWPEFILYLLATYVRVTRVMICKSCKWPNMVVSHGIEASYITVYSYCYVYHSIYVFVL